MVTARDVRDSGVLQRVLRTFALAVVLCPLPACRLLQAAPPCEIDGNCLAGDRCVRNRCVPQSGRLLDGGAAGTEPDGGGPDAGVDAQDGGRDDASTNHPVDGGVDEGVPDGGASPHDAGDLDGGDPNAGLPSYVVPPGWSFGHPIFVNTAGLPGEVENFPLPVRFTGELVDFGGFAPDGADLRFELDGEPLPHIVDLFRVQRSVVWVRVPRLRPDEELTLWMFGGNPSASPPDASAAAEVFSEDFLAVFPMSDQALALGDVFAQHQGTYLVDDGMGRALACGEGTGLDLGRDIPWPAGLSGFTVSGFVRLAAPLANDFALFNVATSAPSGSTSVTSRIALEMNVAGQLRAIVRAPDTSGGARLESVSTVAEGAWHHVALAVDLPMDAVRLSIDGIETDITDAKSGSAIVESYPFDGDVLDSSVSANGAICASDDLSGMFGDARIDEFRVSSAYRSIAWLAAEARVLEPGFVTLGPRLDASP